VEPSEHDGPTDREDVQRLLAERLRNGLLRDGERQRLAVVEGPEGTPSFTLGGRVLVDQGDAAEARATLGKLVAQTHIEERLGVAELVLSDPSAAALAEALAALRQAGIDAAPHHLLFAVAWRGRAMEGDDPEVAERPDGPPSGELPGHLVRVAVVDNGLAVEALADRWLQGIELDPRDVDHLNLYELARTPPTSYLDVGAGHGTFVVGVLRQLAPGCEVAIIRALDSDGVGTELEVARGILRAVDARAQVINLSIGGYAADDRPPLLLERAMRAIPGDVVVVAAAGNEGEDRPVWPGAIRRVVSVAATTSAGDDDPMVVTDELMSWSNRGWWVDVAAPGTWSSVYVKGAENPAIETDDRPDVFQGFARASGTSFAAAAVSGAIAAEMRRGELTARQALKRVLARRRNVTLAAGGLSLDLWDDD
jgi:subtilisin family serine protease